MVATAQRAMILQTHIAVNAKSRSHQDSAILPVIEKYEYNTPEEIFLSEKGVKGEKLFLFF